jgi:precorrin-6B methylase 2
MATTILSGRSLILTIATKDYSDQILSANLTIDTERLTFDTIAGRAYKYLDKNATLDLTFLNDIGETDSITKALWDATESAPDTVLAAVLTATTGKTFTFNVLPNFPSQGGSGSDAQQVTTSLQVSGTITEVLT